MLLELCRGGSLAELLMRRAAEGRVLTAAEVARGFHDMALALAHLHEQSPPLAHRDVKPENYILSTADGGWRLCDFGSATRETFTYQAGMAAHAVALEEERVHRYSTPQYRAPEMCDPRRGETIGIAADVWALGVSLYKMLYLRDLFGTAGEERLAILNFEPERKLAQATRPARPPADADGARVLEEALLALLHACLTPSAAARPPVSALLQDLATAAGGVSGGVGGGMGGGVGAHQAGRLVLSRLAARSLFPKSLRGGIKAYVLVTCGGTRRFTTIAPRSRDASWAGEIAISTHLRRPIEITIWAAHRRASHDFLGQVTLHPEALVENPAATATLPLRWMALQQRSHRSRVSGHVSCELSWTPYRYSSAAASAPVPPVAAATPPPIPAAVVPPAGGTTAAAGGVGSFWATDAAAANAFAATPATPTPPPPLATMPADFNGSFAAFGDAFGEVTPAATATAPPHEAAPAAGASPTLIHFGADGPAPAPPIQAATGAPLFFVPQADAFASVATHAAPWELPPSAEGSAGAGGAASAADSATFWASFDASPAFTASFADAGGMAPAAGGAGDAAPATGASGAPQHAAAMSGRPTSFPAADATPTSLPASLMPAARPAAPMSSGSVLDDLSQLDELVAHASRASAGTQAEATPSLRPCTTSTVSSANPAGSFWDQR